MPPTISDKTNVSERTVFFSPLSEIDSQTLVTRSVFGQESLELRNRPSKKVYLKNNNYSGHAIAEQAQKNMNTFQIQRWYTIYRRLKFYISLVGESCD